MKRVLVVAAAAVLAMGAAREAHALWRQLPITPGNTTGYGRSFTITARKEEAVTDFLVTVKSTEKKQISPFISSKLSLYGQDTHYGTVPVAEHWKDGVVTYRFQVAPKLIADSRMEIHESLYTERTAGARPRFQDERGGRRHELLMGGTIYTINLRDFAAAAPGGGKEGASRR